MKNKLVAIPSFNTIKRGRKAAFTEEVRNTIKQELIGAVDCGPSCIEVELEENERYSSARSLYSALSNDCNLQIRFIIDRTNGMRSYTTNKKTLAEEPSRFYVVVKRASIVDDAIPA